MQESESFYVRQILLVYSEGNQLLTALQKTSFFCDNSLPESLNTRLHSSEPPPPDYSCYAYVSTICHPIWQIRSSTWNLHLLADWREHQHVINQFIQALLSKEVDWLFKTINIMLLMCFSSAEEKYEPFSFMYLPFYSTRHYSICPCITKKKQTSTELDLFELDANNHNSKMLQFIPCVLLRVQIKLHTLRTL